MTFLFVRFDYFLFFETDECMYVFHWTVSIDSFVCETFKETRLELPVCRLAISSDSNCSVF